MLELSSTEIMRRRRVKMMVTVTVAVPANVLQRGMMCQALF